MVPMDHVAPADGLVAALCQALGSHAVVTSLDALRTYDADASMIVACIPDLVAVPATLEQAATAVRLALQAGYPIVARGAGTGIAGGAVPVRRGLVLSFARMEQIEQVETRSRFAVVQAGVVNAELNAYLAPLGFQFAPDPSSQRASTIGGNLGTNAGGPHCLKYGVTTNHILAVELVRPDGTLVWTGDGVAEASGYDLTGVIVGSEGTFGPVTRAIVRLTPLPEANRVVLALFPSVIAASAAVSAVIAAGSLPTSLEVMDHNGIRAVNGAYGLGLPEAEGTTLLIIEVDGVEDGLDDLLEQILQICRDQGAFELRPARTPVEQARVWAARKAFAGAIGRLAPAYLLVDTSVPRTRLPLMMEHVERLRQEYGMEVCNVFHAGDGNLHPLVLYDPRDADQTHRAHAIAEAVLALSIEQGGVISGEHGIGLEKQDFLPLLMSLADLQLHAAVFAVFNPTNQFNPAKIFPTAMPPLDLAAQRRARLHAAREPQLPVAALADTLRQLLGSAYVSAHDAQVTIQPGTVEELAASVAVCYRAGVAVVPLGGGTPPELDHTSTDVQVVILTQRLTRVCTYAPDDLTIGVEAGMTLAALRRLLATNGQQLPLDVAGAEQATLGGLVAAAVDGPRRTGYGTLRDWVLGMTVVEADGTLVRLGAQVVKNVSGYDLPKLFVGSRGTLGIIATVSLKVFPQPPTTATLVLTCPDRASAFALVDHLAASRLQPTAVEYVEAFQAAAAAVSLQVPEHIPTIEAGSPSSQTVLSPLPLLYIRAEGHPAAVERHLRELALMAGSSLMVSQHLEGEAESALWHELIALDSAGSDPHTARIRLAVPPADLCEAVEDAGQLAVQCRLGLRLNARALNGVAYLHATGATEDLRQFYTLLAERWLHVHLLDATPAVRAGLHPWGFVPAQDLMRTLKTELDPQGCMHPSVRFVP